MFIFDIELFCMQVLSWFTHKKHALRSVLYGNEASRCYVCIERLTVFLFDVSYQGSSTWSSCNWMDTSFKSSSSKCYKIWRMGGKYYKLRNFMSRNLRCCVRPLRPISLPRALERLLSSDRLRDGASDVYSRKFFREKMWRKSPPWCTSSHNFKWPELIRNGVWIATSEQEWFSHAVEPRHCLHCDVELILSAVW